VGAGQLTVKITKRGTVAQVLFDGNAGQQVSLQVVSQTFSSACTAGQIRVTPGPNGTYLSTVNFCAGATLLTLPVTGTYTLAFVPSGTDTGNIVVNLQNAPAIKVTSSLNGVPSTLTTTVPGQLAQITFATPIATQVSLQVSGSTFPSGCSSQQLTLTGPTLWNPYGPNWVWPYNLCPQASLMQLWSSGTYTLVLIPHGTDVGSVTITLTSAPTVTATTTIDGPPATVTTTVPAQQAQFIFTTTSANQQLSYQVTANAFAGSCYSQGMSLSGPAPSLNTLLSTVNSCAQATTLFTGALLATAGTYTLTLVPAGANVGSLSIQLKNAPTVTAPVTIGGAAATVTTTIPSQPAQFTFTTTSDNQQVSLQVSNSTYPSYCALGHLGLTGPSPATTSLGNYNFCTGVSLKSMPTAGTYTLTVQPSGSDTGSVTVQLQNAPTVTASATIGGPAVTVTTTVPAQQGQVTFTTATDNQQVSLQVSNSTYPSNCAYGSLNLTGPSPSTTSINGYNFCTGASLMTLPTAGTYTLTVQPSGSDTGSVTIQLQSAPTVTATATVGGSPVTVTTTVPAEQGQVTFTTTSANQQVSLQVSNATYPSNCGYGSLTLTGPSPSTTYIGSYNVCTGASLMTLPTAGIYTLTVKPWGSDTGSVTIQLQNAPTVTATATIGGSPVTVTTTVPAEQGQITFTTTSANQQVSLQVSNATYPSNCAYGSLALTGPSPSTTYISGYNVCTGASLMTLPTAGTYTLTVKPWGSDTGSVTIQLQNAPTVTASATLGGSPVTVTTTVPAQQGQVTFATTSANQQVSLQVSNATYPTNCAYGSLALTGPSPSTTYINGYNFCTGASLMTLPTAGTYTLTVKPSGTDTGSITIQLQNAPTVTASATIGGSPVTVTTTIPAQQAQITFTTTTASQSVNVQVSNSSYPSNCAYGSLALTGPSPSTTYIAGYNFCSGSHSVTLSTIGTYALTARPNGTDVGSVTVQIN